VPRPRSPLCAPSPVRPSADLKSCPISFCSTGHLFSRKSAALPFARFIVEGWRPQLWSQSSLIFANPDERKVLRLERCWSHMAMGTFRFAIVTVSHTLHGCWPGTSKRRPWFIRTSPPSRSLNGEPCLGSYRSWVPSTLVCHLRAEDIVSMFRYKESLASFPTPFLLSSICGRFVQC
jgi:hypothetical protein